MNWRDLPLGGQFAIAAVGAILLVLGAYMYWPNIKEKRQRIDKLEEKLTDLKVQVRQAKELAAREPELRREIADLQLKLEELKAIIPPVRDDAQLLDRLKSLGDRSRLEIDRIQWQRLRDKEFYKEYPIRMDVKGSYHDLAIFFDRLSRESRIFNIHGLKVNADSRSARHTIGANFTATTFVFKEEEEEPGGTSNRRS